MSEEQPKRRWPWIVALFGGGVLGYGGAELATPDIDLVSCAAARHFWAAMGPPPDSAYFFTSPGFGGAAAVLAATLAYLAAMKTREDAKRQAEADRLNALDDRDDDRWWELYQMIYEDAPGLGQNGVTLALEGLEDIAQTEEQQRFLVILSERLLPTDPRWPRSRRGPTRQVRRSSEREEDPS
jgi:hypothetical protein